MSNAKVEIDVSAAIANAPTRRIVTGRSGRKYRIVVRRIPWGSGWKAEGYRIVRDEDGKDMESSHTRLKHAIHWVQVRG